MRTRLSPVAVIIASALVTASIITGELVLLAKYDKVAATFGLPQLSTATMPDGTVLTLHYASFGKNHVLAVPVGKQGLQWGAPATNLRSVNLSTSSDQLVFFVSRHDPETKEFLDFESWSHCQVTDAFEETIQDEHPHRFLYTTSSSKSEGRNRGPFPALTVNDRNYPREGRRILLGIRMKAFRASANPTLDFFDVSGNKVASLPFVSPINVPTAEWEPDSLPATREVTKIDDPTSSPASSFRGQRDLDQPVSLTLKNLELTSRSSTMSNGQTHEYSPLAYQAELLVDGQKTKHWQLSPGNLTDVLGNSASFGNVTLSVNEPSWRVTFKASRTAEASFADRERLVLSGIKVLNSRVTDTALPGIRGGSNQIVPFALLGPGETECDVRTPLYNSSGFSAGGSVRTAFNKEKTNNWARYNLRWRREQYAGTVHLTMKSDLPCLVVTTDSLSPEAQLLVRTVDAEGREVPSHIRKYYDFAHLIFFEADPDAGELTSEILMQTPLEFEFFVAPPELKVVEN